MNAKIICAWCGKEIGDSKNGEGKDSHGICIKCYEKAMEELRDIEKFKPILEKSGEKTAIKGIIR